MIKILSKQFNLSARLLMVLLVFSPQILANIAPIISMDNNNLSYIENAAIIPIDSIATLSDTDGDADWDGGVLIAQIITNNEPADEISIPDNVVGTINTSGNNLLNAMTVIGTLSAIEATVTGGDFLTITFNNNANNALVQQTLRALHYRNTSDAPNTAIKTLRINAIDKFSASAFDTRSIGITVINDTPTIINLPTDFNVNEDIPSNLDLSAATFSDFDSGNLSITFNVSVGLGTLSGTGSGGVFIIGSDTNSMSIIGNQANIESFLNNPNNIKYTSELNANGNNITTLALMANDGGNSGAGAAMNVDLGAVNINITAIDDAPTVANAIADITLNEDANDSLIDISNVFADIDSVNIVVSISHNTNTTLVTPSIIGNSLNLNYSTNQNGSATITIRGTADAQFVEDSFVVNINAIDDAPIVSNPIVDINVNEDDANSIIDLSSVFNDIDSLIITKTVNSNSNPTLVTTTLSGNTLTLNYANNQYGMATIVIRANADGQFVEDSFMVNVNALDDPPTIINGITDINVNEDAPISIIDISNVFSDIDSTNINLTINNNSNSSLVTPAITGNNLQLNYLSNQNGTAEITIRAIADGQFVDDTFMINVNAVDDPPTIINAIVDITVDEDAPDYIIDMSNVFADIDSTNINLTINNNSNSSLVTPTITGNNLQLNYISNQNGTALINIRATADGQFIDDTFMVNVNALDDPPTIINAITDINVIEDAPNTIIDISNVFFDIDSTNINLTINNNSNSSLVTPTITGNNLQLNYLANQNGTAVITIRVTADGQFVDNSFMLTVDAIDDAPTIVNAIVDINVDEDSPITSIDLSNVFADIDTAVITHSILSFNNPVLLSPNINANTLNINYLPDQSGTATITIRATANGKVVDDMFNIIVNAVDDAPRIINPIADIIVNEDATETSIDVSQVFSDIDSATMTLTILSNSNNSLVNANLSNNQLILNYAENQNGTATIILRSTADGLHTDETINVTVNAIDDAPTIANTINNIIDNEDAATKTIDLSQVFTDIDSTIITKSITSNSNNSMVNPSIMGDTLLLNFLTDANGIADITIRAMADGQSIDTQFRVTLLPVNDAPTLSILGNISISEPSVVILPEILHFDISQFVNSFLLGPQDESNQIVQQFALSIVSDSSHIIDAISINNTGDLSLDINLNTGIAMVEVRLQDDGGTANTGKDTSVATPFLVSYIDLIYANGFENTESGIITLLGKINKNNNNIEKPSYDSQQNTITFYQQQLDLNYYQTSTIELISKYWLKEVLTSQDPYGDYDFDGIENRIDKYPFLIDQ